MKKAFVNHQIHNKRNFFKRPSEFRYIKTIILITAAGLILSFLLPTLFN